MILRQNSPENHSLLLRTLHIHTFKPKYKYGFIRQPTSHTSMGTRFDARWRTSPHARTNRHSASIISDRITRVSLGAFSDRENWLHFEARRLFSVFFFTFVSLSVLKIPQDLMCATGSENNISFFFCWYYTELQACALEKFRQDGEYWILCHTRRKTVQA